MGGTLHMKRITRTKTRTGSRTKTLMITALTVTILLSTSAWAIASKAEELDQSKSYLSSKGKGGQVTSLPEVTKETILNAVVTKETISNPLITSNTDKALIAKGKAYTLAIEKARQEEVVRKAEELAKQAEDKRLAKIAADKAKKAETIRLAKVASEKIKEEKLLVKQAEESRVAQAAASKAKQEEIDRISAERADTAKQSQIAENYRQAKAAFDKAEQVKAANLAKIESDRLSKEETARLSKANEDARITKEEADSVTKEEDGSVTKEEVDKLAKIGEKRLARIKANRLAQIEATRLAKKEADRLAAANGLKQTTLGAKLSNFLHSSSNVSSVLNRAVELHGGDPSNTCVYFSSEVMRRMGVSVPLAICNTRQYLSFLRGNGWKANYDIKKLTPGSVCFTSNDWAGYPTHTFVFLGWANSNYTLAYIADNQGNTVHVRNMGATVATDAFAFFMHN